MPEDKLLKIGDIAEASGLPASTIRHYTDMGLLRVAGATDGGHRLYPRSESLEKLSRIQALSRRGLTLPLIRQEINGQSRARRVLLVDDEPEVVELMTEILKKKFPEWDVRVATDGFSAGRIVSEFYPDLVILDLMLPGVDGFAVCSQMRNDPSMAGIVILAITGYDTQEIKDKIMNCGANDFLAKPMDNKVLVEKISKLMNVPAQAGRAKP